MSRNWDDLPPLASDEELLAWSKELNNTPDFEPDLAFEPAFEPTFEPRLSRPNRPLVATRVSTSMTTEELFVDISDRASEAYERLRRRRVVVRG